MVNLLVKYAFFIESDLSPISVCIEHRAFSVICLCCNFSSVSSLVCLHFISLHIYMRPIEAYSFVIPNFIENPTVIFTQKFFLFSIHISSLSAKNLW